MSRQLAQSTLDKFRAVLEEERIRLRELLDEHELERENARLAETAALCGEFNDWEPEKTPMKRRKDGSWSVTIVASGTANASSCIGW